MRPVILALFVVALTSCTQADINQRAERDATARNQQQLLISQPIPAFDWSQERDSLIQIYRLRNEARNTWTVVYSDMGQPLWSCPSVGFPIPGGTQLTSPQQAIGTVVVPLSEPNGLYTDPSTNSTWVLCVRKNGDVVPVYTEPKAMAFPFPVSVKDGKVVEDEQAASTAKVNVKRG